MKQQMDAQLKSGKLDDVMESAGRPKSLADLQAISPMLQIDGQIKSNRLEIANRKQEVERLETQIELYQSRLNMTPVREQQVAAITRDYDQSRTNYESLLNKKMQSEMATNLEKRHEGQQFRIIDAPNFPEKPYSPDRFKFSLLGLVFGIALGIGVTAFVEPSRASDRDGRQSRCQAVTGQAAWPGSPWGGRVCGSCLGPSGETL